MHHAAPLSSPQPKTPHFPPRCCNWAPPFIPSSAILPAQGTPLPTPVLQVGISLILSFMVVWDLPRISRGVQSLRTSRIAPIYNTVFPSLEIFATLFGKALQAQVGEGVTGGVPRARGGGGRRQQAPAWRWPQLSWRGAPGAGGRRRHRFCAHWQHVLGCLRSTLITAPRLCPTPAPAVLPAHAGRHRAGRHHPALPGMASPHPPHAEPTVLPQASLPCSAPCCSPASRL